SSSPRPRNSGSSILIGSSRPLCMVPSQPCKRGTFRVLLLCSLEWQLVIKRLHGSRKANDARLQAVAFRDPVAGELSLQSVPLLDRPVGAGPVAGWIQQVCRPNAGRYGGPRFRG